MRKTIIVQLEVESPYLADVQTLIYTLLAQRTVGAFRIERATLLHDGRYGGLSDSDRESYGRQLGMTGAADSPSVVRKETAGQEGITNG